MPADLTPLGAERKGTPDGAIPAWTGGVTDPERATALKRTLNAEHPLFTVTRANSEHYAALLPEGARALFARDADYRMAVYPTHRSAGYGPQILAAVTRNATTARPVAPGCRFGIENASGGIPFPMPRDGCEAVWNSLLAYWGPARDTTLKTWVVFGTNDVERTSTRDEIADFPWYEAGMSVSSVGPYYFERRDDFTWPADSDGDGYVTRQPVDISTTKFASWEYLVGQRRVRKSPSLSYDTPNPDASGLESFDDYYVFSGGLDRYDWKLLGKQRMIVPYDNDSADIDDRTLLTPRHADPDLIRYEIHRVWVVDATLRPGESDVVPHRRLYLDEDSWFAVYADAWNAEGRLWKFSQGMMDLMPSIPAVILGSQLTYDLQYGAYVYDFDYGKPDGRFALTAPHPASDYTPEGMVAYFQR